MLNQIAQAYLPEPVKRSLRSLRDRILRAGSRVNDRAIYIMGHPRSGTTAIARILGQYTGLKVACEMGWATRYVEDLYARRVPLETVLSEYRYPFSRPIVQTPGLTPVLPLLRARFPALRFLYIVRDPRDMLCSIVALSHRHATDRFEIRDPSFILFRGAWLGLDEDDPIRMVGHRWCKYLEIAQSVPDVQYYRCEDFCADKKGFVARLAGELGLSPVGTVEPNLDVQYRDNGPVRGVGRWKDELPPSAVQAIEGICRVWMEKFGYPVAGHVPGNGGGA